MNDNTQDANTVDSSAIETNETQNDALSQQDTPSQSEQTQVLPSEQADANQSAAPNQLPPKDNLYGEFRRKIFEEISPLIQGAVRESMLGLQQNQASSQQQTQEAKYQGKYSKADLEAILRHPDANDYDKNFANRGLSVLEAKEEITREVRADQERTISQSRQNQAIQSIISDYPQVFNRQANTWNFSDPLFQRAMQFYNSDDRLRAFGNEGLRVALDMAYAQEAREGKLQTRKQQVQITTKQRQLDKAQSQALNSGGLTSVKQDGQKTSKAKVWEAYKNNPNDPALRTAAMADFIPKSWRE